MKNQIVIMLGRLACNLYYAETRTGDDSIREILQEARSKILQEIDVLKNLDHNSWKKYLPNITQLVTTCRRVAVIVGELKDILSIFYINKGVHMNLNKFIGNRLKVVRTLSGQKQSDVANNLNISPSLLSMFEKGKREPSVTFLYSFSTHFKLPLDQFFFGFDNSGLVESDPNNPFQSLANDFKIVVTNLEKQLLSNQSHASTTEDRKTSNT